MATASIATFEADIGKFFGQITNLKAFVQDAAQTISERVIEATPVDTGFLKGSWQPALNGGDTSANGYAAASVQAVVSQMKVGDIFSLVNNAAYAMRIEYGFVGPDSLGRVFNQPGRYTMTEQLYQWSAVCEALLPKYLK